VLVVTCLAFAAPSTAHGQAQVKAEAQQPAPPPAAPLEAAPGAACSPAEKPLPVLVPPVIMLMAVLGQTVGEPLECVHGNVENADLLQQTSTGLLVYRTLSGTAVFTNGYVHWAMTSDGLLRWFGSGLDPPWVEIVSVSGAPPGGLASVVARTSPNATCTLEYVTPSGSASRAVGLALQTADGDGQVSWSWRIGVATRRGAGQVAVTCDGARTEEVLMVE
jgi:hypothetical protein